MSAHFKVFALFAVLIASFGIIPAFAQAADPITVRTDKSSYSDGETVLVSGQVSEIFSGLPVTVRIITPLNNIIEPRQIDIGPDKKFTAEITAEGPLWKAAGTYTVEAFYGVTTQKTAQTTFEFSGSSGMVQQKPPTTIKVEGTDFLVSYKIIGGKVLSITPEQGDGYGSLIIKIEATSDGELTITLPRELIDAILPDGSDDAFFVLVDGEERVFDEIETTDTQRTLRIPFEAGAEEIEIIGTFVVPEFGTVAALILAVAIISIVAVTARSRLSIMPKY